MVGADVANWELVLERIMRVLVCNGYASRCGLDKYTATAFSRQMMERTTIGTMESM